MREEGCLELQRMNNREQKDRWSSVSNKCNILLIGKGNMIYSLTLHHSARVRLGRGLGSGGGQMCIATVQRMKQVHR